MRSIVSLKIRRDLTRHGIVLTTQPVTEVYQVYVQIAHENSSQRKDLQHDQRKKKAKRDINDIVKTTTPAGQLNTDIE